jgi:hypothetical protein
VICSECGVVMPKVIVGNIIDYRHPDLLVECGTKPDRGIAVSTSWEPAARHYRDIAV